jgi:hypothetical protein
MWLKVRTASSSLFFSFSFDHILVSQKANFLRFETIIVPYIFVYVIIGFVTLFLGAVFWLIPFFIIFFLALALRFHLIQAYQIQQNHCFVEFLFGFFCCPCSIAQSMFSSRRPLLLSHFFALVSRHVFGYQEVLDGDSRPFAKDYYDPPIQV